MDDNFTNYVDDVTLLDPSLLPLPISSNMTLNFDGLKRARAIKAEISSSLSIQQQKEPSLHYRVEEDPEIQQIKTMRKVHGMGWGTIAKHLNEERLRRGEPTSLTAPAVYSCFIRNGSRIATTIGDVNFDPKEYMHLRKPNQNSSISLSHGGEPDFGMGEGRKRTSVAGKEERQPKANTRKHSELNQQATELEDITMTEMLMNAVATVEQNYWSFVANELERTSGRTYDANTCKSRFHAI